MEGKKKPQRTVFMFCTLLNGDVSRLPFILTCFGELEPMLQRRLWTLKLLFVLDGRSEREISSIQAFIATNGRREWANQYCSPEGMSCGEMSRIGANWALTQKKAPRQEMDLIAWFQMLSGVSPHRILEHVAEVDRLGSIEHAYTDQPHFYIQPPYKVARVLAA